MSIWHEATSPTINHVLPSSDGRVRAVIERRDHFGSVNTLYFLRWHGAGKPLSPKLAPSEWQELWPRTQITTTTLPEAKAEAHARMESVGSGAADDFYDVRPCRVARRLERVKEIDHPAGKLKAIVLKHTDVKYEVRYFLHELLGVWQQTQTEEWDWVRTKLETVTFATDLESAEEAARTEMEQMTAPGSALRDWFARAGERPPRPRERQE